MHFILASSSIIRQQIIHQVGWNWQFQSPNFTEIINPLLSPRTQARTLAYGKALSVYKLKPKDHNFIIVGCDTLISFQGKIIGKPPSLQAANQTLQNFIGNPQKIITGVSLLGRHNGKKISKNFSVATEVIFAKNITQHQIADYLRQTPYQLRCGGYSVLDAGITFLEKINGDFYNIVGLPILHLNKSLQQIIPYPNQS